MAKRLGVLLLLFVSGLAQAEQALLWQVERDGHVSHLFGTIHSPDPRVTRLPPQVEEAFAAAQTLVLEIRLDSRSSMDLAQAMLLPAGETLRDRLPAPLYRDTLAATSALGYPDVFIQRLQPWAVVITLSSPPERAPVLDKRLFERAVEAEKKVVGLEAADEQIAVFAELSESEQLALLRQAVAEAAHLEEELERLTRAYLDRDLEALMEKHQRSAAALPEGLREKLERRLLTTRNRRMAERLMPLLEEGGVFAAVGALHLVGPTGLVQRLRSEGYAVTAIY